MKRMSLLAVLIVIAGCTKDAATSPPPPAAATSTAGTFQADVDFLKKHTPVILLTSPDGRSQAAVAPAYQGRVMTSTAGGPAGASFGWINRDLIASGKNGPHMNAFGGEDRFWLGPEGGPFSIFFAKGANQEFATWQTPPALDTEAFDVADAGKPSPTTAAFTKTMRLTNASGTTFDLRVDRTVQLADDPTIAKAALGPIAAGVRAVGVLTVNRVTNTGAAAWRKETGLLSIWILGMLNPSPTTTIVVPLRRPPAEVVNDTYFGKVPADRLSYWTNPKPSADAWPHAALFRGDGQHRSKIGVSPKGATNVLGSYDATKKVLTLVRFNLPQGTDGLPYVNSTWGEQKAPYAGDAVNSYNDGPPTPGAKPMGPFYELETSSPAAALDPGKAIVHTHLTVHFEGPEAELDPIARRTLGVGLGEIATKR